MAKKDESKKNESKVDEVTKVTEQVIETPIAILQVVDESKDVTVIGTALFVGHEGKEFVVSGNVANALLHVKKVVLK